MFSVGDVIEMNSPVAGKKKYHLCVCPANAVGITKYLFLNSGQGYAADFVMPDGTIKCLPPSPTGNSVVSCSLVLRYNAAQLTLFKAKKLGTIDAALAGQLEAFVRTSTALPKSQRVEVADSLKSIS